MKITVDTNVILRALMRDHPVQSTIAMRELESAESVSFPTAALCETVWVLRRAKWSRPDITRMLRVLLDDARAVAEWEVVHAGLNLMDEGGDFADGIIAADGSRLGGAVFATFDSDSARRLARAGRQVRLLG